MPRSQANAQMSFTVTLELTEDEARAMEALASYNHPKVLEVFYKHLGEHYMKPHAKGFLSVLAHFNENIPFWLKKIDDSRDVFNGRKVAKHKEIAPVVAVSAVETEAKGEQ